MLKAVACSNDRRLDFDFVSAVTRSVFFIRHRWIGFCYGLRVRGFFANLYHDDGSQWDLRNVDDGIYVGVYDFRGVPVLGLPWIFL